MNFQQKSYYKNYILLALVIFITASCSGEAQSAPIIIPQVVIPAAAAAAVTLTPFQSQNNTITDPYSQPSSAPIETFTPYPMPYFAAEGLPTPAEIIPPDADAAAIPSQLEIINPLTGLPASDPSLLQRRPLAIKVANAPDYIRPQSGLTLADVVFEYYIEWGDTRFIAVFYGNDSSMVGPVRSGRYFDEHVARMYNAFLVFKYADPREYSYLKNSTLHDFLVVPGNTTCPPFGPGDKKRDEYNNYFFNTLKWAECAAKKGLDNSPQVPRNGFFAEEIPESALNVNRIFLFYSIYNYSYWEYDPITQKYFRYQEANDIIKNKTEAYAPLFDAQTGQQVNADNIVTLFVPYTFANQFNAEDEVYNVDLIDSGNAYVFRDGVAIPAQWHRTDVNQPLLLTSLMGTPIYMHPGRTFYEVMGVSSSYTQDTTDWRFTFSTP